MPLRGTGGPSSLVGVRGLEPRTSSLSGMPDGWLGCPQASGKVRPCRESLLLSWLLGRGLQRSTVRLQAVGASTPCSPATTCLIAERRTLSCAVTDSAVTTRQGLIHRDADHVNEHERRPPLSTETHVEYGSGSSDVLNSYTEYITCLDRDAYFSGRHNIRLIGPSLDSDFIYS